MERPLCERCGKPTKQPDNRYCSRTCYRADPITRFWSHVDKSNPDGCWPWTAGLDKDGYGKFYVEGRTVHAHRWIYEYTYGPLPEDIFTCHNCPEGDRPSCVRIDHLFAGTNTDNQQDAIRKGLVDPYHIVRAHQRLDWRGENGASHKLTTEQVLRIRSIDYTKHGTQARVAREYGVEDITISCIRRGKTWKNLL